MSKRRLESTARAVAALLGVSALLASFVLFGCEPMPAAAPKAQFAIYEGRFSELFDDGIEASAVGMVGNTHPHSRQDPELLERAHVADGIVKVRVKTVTTKIEGDQTAYVLELEPFGRLGGAKAPGHSFSVRFEKTAPGFGIVRSIEGRLVGKTFIAFVREFTNPAAKGGEAAYHVHLAPSTPDVEAAVKEAVVLDEVH